MHNPFKHILLNATIKRNNVRSRTRVSLCYFNTIMLYHSQNTLPSFTDDYKTCVFTQQHIQYIYI